MQGPRSLSMITAILGVVATPVALADLTQVDLGPYLEANGHFPAWYQDGHGRVLDLCLSKAVSSRVGGAPGAPAYMCALAPEPGVYDDTQPFAFPTNFPGESFWFTADAAIEDAATGIELSYGAALEAAFAVEGPAENEQISFARIRIRVDLTVPGTYTITHPYGVEIFTVTAEDIAEDGGDRVINMTRDLGIGQPGNFGGALTGDIGPFLRSVNGPYQEQNPDTGAVERYIGDPNLEEAVTGSPFNTNYVRIEGPGGIDLRTDQFAILGKLGDVALATPVTIDRATYARQQTDAGVATRQDLFVQAPPAPASVEMVDTAGTAAPMTEADGTGHWHGHTGNAATPLANVTVTADNTQAIPSSINTTLQAPLTDHVVISRAEYSLATGTLTVAASSSDEVSPPTLTAYVASSGALIDALDASGVLTTGITPLPPARVRVESAHGGSDVEEVVILP